MTFRAPRARNATPHLRTRLAGFIRRPRAEEIRELAAMEYMDLSLEECRELAELLDDALSMIDEIDDIPLPSDFLKVKYSENREQGYRPGPDEDPYNVFIRKCRVTGSSDGPLKGKRVGLKDNIRVAGIPMTNASRLVGSYIPGVDAVVVERLLDNGAEIVGKVQMDDFSFAGTGETSIFGLARNPANPDYSPGGSSGGSGAAVAAGEVDIALGVDQGGSGRIPAAWCGVVSIKPTHGLVPTFGISHMDHTLDALCPTAQRVHDVALALQAIAGEDSRDPQWRRKPVVMGDYLANLEDGVAGMKIGLVTDSIGLDVSEKDVDDAVLRTVQALGDAGAETSEITVPLWKHAWTIWNGFFSHSISAMIESDLEGYSRGGACDPDWQRAFGMARRVVGAFDPSPQLKVLILLGKYLRRQYCSTYFSKATNLRLAMTQNLDDILSELDVLVTPTCPMKAFKLADEPFTVREFGARSAPMAPITSATSVTGHPSASVPCGRGENNLPIGVQIIGAAYDEATVLRVAKTVEEIMAE